MNDPYFVPTRCSQALGTENHAVVVFTEGKKDVKPSASERKSNTKESNELDMKAARFEVYKFAQTGLTNSEKQNNQKELAIKLGAVAVKNKMINYKKLKRKETIKKEQNEKDVALSKLGYIHRPVRSFKNSSHNSRNPKAKLKKKMDIGTGILKKYGKVKMKKKSK